MLIEFYLTTTNLQIESSIKFPEYQYMLGTPFLPTCPSPDRK